MACAKRFGIRVGLLLFVCVVLAGFGNPVAVNAQSSGSRLIIAEPFETVTLDGHQNTRRVTHEYLALIAEGLLAFDENWIPRLKLAEDLVISPDGLTHTFYLRRGVLFHDGTEMTSEDVVASLERWMKWAQGASTAPYIDRIEAVDRYTVAIHLKEPYPVLTTVLTTPFASGAYILPAHQIREYGNAPIDRPIGTGPYQFDEWRRGEFFRVRRFDRYSAREEEPSGWAGNQTAHFEFVEFHLVPDATVRAFGIETGQYHVVREMPGDLYERFANNPDLRVTLFESGPMFIRLNMIGKWTKHRDFRRALMLTLDKHELAGSVGDPVFFPGGNCNLPAPTYLLSDVCQEAYLRYDPEEAKRLLQQVGYDGSPIRFVTDGGRDHFLYPALYATQAWTDIGVNIDLQIVDSATLLDWRDEPDRWDILIYDHSGRPHPALWSPFQPDHYAWFGAFPEELLDMLTRFTFAPTIEEQKKIWEEILMYTTENVTSWIKIADRMEMAVERREFTGSWPTTWANYGSMRPAAP